jgi:hypothetical protein
LRADKAPGAGAPTRQQPQGLPLPAADKPTAGEGWVAAGCHGEAAWVHTLHALIWMPALLLNAAQYVPVMTHAPQHAQQHHDLLPVCAAFTGDPSAAAPAPAAPAAPAAAVAKAINGTVATAAAAATAEAAAGGGAGWVSGVLPPLPPACAGLSAATCDLCRQTASPGDCFTCVRNSALAHTLLTVAVLSDGLAPGSAGNVRLDQCISCANITAAGDRGK